MADGRGERGGERGGAALPPWVVDALLGGAVFLVLSLVISADQGGRHGPDTPAYLWAAGLGALMLARRRHPGIVLAVTALGLFSYYAAGYPAVGVAVPVAAALFSAAEFGRLAQAVVTTAAVLAVSLFFRLLEGQDASFVVGYELAGHVLLMGAAIALGDSLRSRRSVQEGARRIADLAAERSRQDTEARVHAERLAIARELHDSIGHSTSVVSLHADVAREALGHDEAQARAALDLIKSAATHSMTELRRTVALLRAPGESGRTVGSLAGVESLRASASAAGLDVDLHVDLDAARCGLPAAVDASAFRILQEAVTNIVRHSRGSRARISVRADADAEVLRLTVSDDGPPDANGTPRPPVHDTPGHGIAGMRERAEALGGFVTAGHEGAGFVVRAVLPLTWPVERSA